MCFLYHDTPTHSMSGELLEELVFHRNAGSPHTHPRSKIKTIKEELVNLIHFPLLFPSEQETFYNGNQNSSPYLIQSHGVLCVCVSMFHVQHSKDFIVYFTSHKKTLLYLALFVFFSFPITLSLPPNASCVYLYILCLKFYLHL